MTDLFGFLDQVVATLDGLAKAATRPSVSDESLRDAGYSALELCDRMYELRDYWYEEYPDGIDVGVPD